ncbi:GntR family transcriptional regulator [Oceanomicrobium pacificus]|uniref:FCD domain-containing protein n=1 Tax=Oceanomicrobium pacificus TaxID=2692916 RepID=A0A6B0TYD6_9RHOB|nr:GntR family transcriptional regulator [Oceanomicrobium pacificus]MXU66715.1 FCD domain-containing protein [Oceanomicrobium pacificus]
MTDTAQTEQRPVPVHEQVHAELREMILLGHLAPGQPVTLQGLVELLGAGMTPVRESVRRLIAEGALEFQGNRRVCVPVMDAARFAELEFARLALEPRLAEEACHAMNAADIEALKAIDLKLDQAIESGDAAAYMAQNYRFHFALYGASGAQILLPMAESLWLRYGPLSRVICGKYGTLNMTDRHEEALSALRAGDAKAVAQAIRDDICEGFQIVRSTMNWPAEIAAPALAGSAGAQVAADEVN